MTVNSPDDDKRIGEEARRQEAAERGRTIAASHFPEVFAPEKKGAAWPVLFAAVIFLGLGAVLYVLLPPAGGISDAEARDQIIKESVAAHQASGSPCACPYNVMADGRECAGFSAYNRPGGTAPLCYPKDVTSDAIHEWRQQQSSR